MLCPFLRHLFICFLPFPSEQILFYAYFMYFLQFGNQLDFTSVLTPVLVPLQRPKGETLGNNTFS
jgi:hypothetical protein